MNREFQFTRRDVVFILSSLAVLVFMIVLICLQVRSLRDARASVAAEQLALEQHRARLQSLIALSKKADIMQIELATCDALMPGSPQESALMRDLQHLGDTSQTSFIEISFDKRSPKAGYTEMPVTISYEGLNNGLVELLHSLQTWQRAIRIDELRVGKGSLDYPQLRADIKASAFYQQTSSGETGGDGK